MPPLDFADTHTLVDDVINSPTGQPYIAVFYNVTQSKYDHGHLCVVANLEQATSVPQYSPPLSS
jgi:hypothetical protein